MNILFVHQNYPGQYFNILNHLTSSGDHRIVFITQLPNITKPKNHDVIHYRPDHGAKPGTYAYSRDFENCTANGVKVVEICQSLERAGFKPQLAIGHSGWGEMLFIKDHWPGVPILSYFEFYFSMAIAGLGFGSEFPVSEDTPFKLRARNAINHLSYEQCDAGQTPTNWQRDIYPESFHEKIFVCHEGVKTDICVPNEKVSVNLGRVAIPVTRKDEIITYVARNLEPVRGFHIFMRALPKILEARPKARVLIVGGNNISYSYKSPSGKRYRDLMLEEVGDELDSSRVHFLGNVPYDSFLEIIQLSRCHIYLTVPFVLSWSFLEAMSSQTTVVASDTSPVREVIEHGKNGLLVEFSSHEALSETVIDVLKHRNNYRGIGEEARAHIMRNYDFQKICLPAYLGHLNLLLPRKHQFAI